MKILARHILENFKRKHTDVRSQIDAWESEAKDANWEKPSDVKQRYVTASILSNDHVVFNLKGNKYRLLVQVNYRNKIILIKKVGTHQEYMKWEI